VARIQLTGETMNRRLTTFAFAALLALSASAITFTGDVEADFAAADCMLLVDGGSPDDVGLPLNAPPGTISGWDIERILLHWDHDADALEVGIKFYGIAGDADGDGVDGSTSPWLGLNGGVDQPGLAGTESICMAFDFDLDGVFDTFAGVSVFSAEFIVAEVAAYDPGSTLPILPGVETPEHDGGWYYNPTVSSPDFEFRIAGLSEIQGPCFMPCLSAFAGSLEDDGICEATALGCFEFSSNVPARPPRLSVDLADDALVLHWSAITEDTLGHPSCVLNYRVFSIDWRTNASTWIETVWFDTTYTVAPIPDGVGCFRVTAGSF